MFNPLNLSFLSDKLGVQVDPRHPNHGSETLGRVWVGLSPERAGREGMGSEGEGSGPKTQQMLPIFASNVVHQGRDNLG